MTQKRTDAKTETGTWPGGTHNPGQPREDVVRRHLRVPLTADAISTSPHGGGHGGMPIKGAGDAEAASGAQITAAYRGATADKPGERAAFVLVQTGGAETPVFLADADGQDEAVAVFSSREKATLYLQEANWQGQYGLQDLAPPLLEALAETAQKEGVRFLAVDLNRIGRTQSNFNNFLDLTKLNDRGGENLYREIWERGNR